MEFGEEGHRVTAPNLNRGPERAPRGGARIATLGANAVTYMETVSKGQYAYRVQAFNSTTVSAYSNPAQAKVH